MLNVEMSGVGEVMAGRCKKEQGKMGKGGEEWMAKRRNTNLSSKSELGLIHSIPAVNSDTCCTQTRLMPFTKTTPPPSQSGIVYSETAACPLWNCT